MKTVSGDFKDIKDKLTKYNDSYNSLIESVIEFTSGVEEALHNLDVVNADVDINPVIWGDIPPSYDCCDLVSIEQFLDRSIINFRYYPPYDDMEENYSVIIWNCWGDLNYSEIAQDIVDRSKLLNSRELEAEIGSLRSRLNFLENENTKNTEKSDDL